MSFADLELGLHRRGEHRYAVELRFTQPGSDADIRLAREEIVAELDQNALAMLQDDPNAYGAALSKALFAAPGLLTAFEQARAAVATLDIPLRLRLFVGASAPELQGLRWETLRDPAEERPLLTDERLLFSRYLAAGDWRPVKLRPRAALRALVVVANPSDLTRYGFAPIAAEAELASARASLGSIAVTALGETGCATLDNIVARLREGYDILYLMAHGAIVDGEPWLWLESEEGVVARTPGSELAQRIRELEQRPRLVVLASCQSAGAGQLTADGMLAALGPRLSEAGVPAVVAMQGNFSMETAAAFLPVFFAELQRDGQIDRALAVARGRVRERDDSWMPALFMRLRSGKIWYVPGFGDESAGFEKWPTLVRSLKRGQCTPILGPTLAASVLGAPDEIAESWAEQYNFPLSYDDKNELAQVAQYLAINQSAQFPRDELIEYLRQTLLRRFADDLAEDSKDAHIYDLLSVAGEIQRERNPQDPHAVLAAQPIPVFVTAGQHNLLSEALRAAGKDPMVEFCRWNEDIVDLPSVFDDEPDYQPSAERPLVFHLFGILDEPDSLVLTEDDYFDYLIQVSRNLELIPLPVREALADTALLFLGFRLDDRSFRVLYRSLMQQEGRGRRRKYAHIAGQVAPDEERFLLPERAQSFLEGYFQNADISIFWGSPEDFARELHTQILADVSAAAKPAPERASLRRR